MKLDNLTVTIILAGINLLGLIFSIVGVASIKWEYTNESNHVLLILVLILFIFTLGISIIFFLVFFKKKLCLSNKMICFITAITGIIISVISLIFSIVCLAIGVTKFDDIKEEAQREGYLGIPSSNQRGVMISMQVLTLIMNVLQIPFWVIITLTCLKYRGAEGNSTATEVKVNYGNREINLN